MAKETKLVNEFNERALWVLAGIDALRPDFEAAQLPLPERIRVGFSTKGKGTNKTGEAWHSPASRDGAYELFIRADQDDPYEILCITARMCVHLGLPADESHGKKYKAAANRVGLVGKMRSATPNHLLRARLQTIAEHLGPLPHAALDLSWRPFEKKKSQGPGMLKAICSGGLNPETSKFEECGYTFRLSTKWTEMGAQCPRHGAMQIEFPDDDAETDAAPDNPPEHVAPEAIAQHEEHPPA